MEEVVPQCGYCQPGFMMATAAMLEKIPNPTDKDIDNNIANICRCGTYYRMRKAIHKAAEIKNTNAQYRVHGSGQAVRSIHGFQVNGKTGKKFVLIGSSTGGVDAFDGDRVPTRHEYAARHTDREGVGVGRRQTVLLYPDWLRP